MMFNKKTNNKIEIIIQIKIMIINKARITLAIEITKKMIKMIKNSMKMCILKGLLKVLNLKMG